MELMPIALHTANAADRVALRGVRLRARLSGMAQQTTIEQTFVNLESRAIEAVYTFPLPEGAAVSGFEVVTGDRVLTGKIEEAEQAVEQYENAVSEGHGAFLMEQERPDVFTVRVGNIKPKQAATIRLTYVCALERADQSIRVAFPTVVAPRYVTATATDPLEAMIDGDALNPPHVLSVPYGLSMEVQIDLGRALRGVYSPSHSVRVDRGAGDGDRDPWTVTLAGGVTEMNREIVLNLDLAREAEPSVQVERGKTGESYLAVTFVPEFDVDELTDPPPTETVFVLDCSGSMQGESIRQAVAALELCLRSLSPGDTFNVCRFGSSFELMAPEPLVYSQETLDRALKYVRQGADLGGTELHAPLAAIFQTRPRAGTAARQVILLTDGQVSNEPAVIQLARKHRARNRIFTFGIGAASSAYLVKGLARATGGAAEFITAGERIDEKVLRTFGRLTSPVVSDLSIDWDGCEVQTLAEPPPVFDGDVLAVFGRAPGRLPGRVTLSCRTPQGPKTWSLAVPPPLPTAAGETVIATMWARRMIQSLEEVSDLQRSRSAKGDTSRERQTLINLSKEFGLLCGLTTFIAVEHRSPAERNEGQPELRRVPVVLAKGWGDVDQAPMMVRAMHGSFASVSEGRSVRRRAAPATRAPAPMADDMDVRCCSEAADDTTLGAVLDEITPSTTGFKSKGGPAAGGGGRARKEKQPGVFDKLKKAFKGKAEALAAGAALPPSAAADGGTLSQRRGTGPGDELQAVLSLQSADGWFGSDATVNRLLQDAGGERWRQEVGAAALPAVAEAGERERVVQTVLVLLLLSTRFADRDALWRRAYRKASKDYLAKALGKSVADVEAWLDSLRNRLGAAQA